MKRLAILGAGDLGLQLAHLATLTGKYHVVGHFDDHRELGTVVGRSTVLGNLADVEDRHNEGLFDCVIVAIGYRHMKARRELHSRLRGLVPFATIVHPSAVIDPTCRISAGAVIYSGCVLDMSVFVGENSLLNVGCVIAHHSCIGAHSFLSPAVSIAGFVGIGEGCVLGIGTVVIDNITIINGARTGAGAVVTQSIDRCGLWIGIPARFAKENVSS